MTPQEAYWRGIYRQWGLNVKAARGKFWTQDQLAEVCGIHRAALANIERGKRCPRDDVKERLAGALRMPVGELFPWPEAIPPFPDSRREQVAS